LDAPAVNSRIRILDILRGFAVLGTLGTNIWIFAHLGDLQSIFTYGRTTEWWNSADTFVNTLALSLITGKFLGLLAILFGVGLELKYRQFERRGRAWPGAYLLVCAMLMLEGLIHFALVMEYDILMGYAAAGVIVAFIVRGGSRAIRRALIGFGSVHVVLILLSVLGDASFGSMDEVVRMYRDGTWLEQVSYRLSHFLELRFEVVFTLPLNVFLFLLGVLLMRSGAFEAGERGRLIRRRMLRIGLAAGLPLNLLLFVPGGLFDFPVRYLFAPVLSVGYMALFAAAFEKRPRLALWGWLERAGRMSLSLYVLQNLLGNIVFYGWGLGLGGRLNAWEVLASWLALTVVQLIFAQLWLKRFRLGPMEFVRKRVVA